MHISEGVLSPAVLGAGAVLAAAGIVIGLRKLDYDRLMTVAILAAAFFVGMLLGWAAFPSIFVALMLQAILFQYGGITVLGVNTFNMAFPAVVCYYAFRPMLLKSARQRIVGAFCCGALSVAGAGLLTALSLSFSAEGFLRTAQILFLAHIPVMIVEGVITALAVSFIAKVRPEILQFSKE